MAEETHLIIDNECQQPSEWFVEVAICQAHGHRQFSEQVVIPHVVVEENSDLKHGQGPKVHPISQHVYFSGVPEVNQLPHESRDALENYLQHKLSLQNELTHAFNPKPMS